MTLLVTWHRSPLWDRREPPWEDDGCEGLRRAAVASVPGLHPRVRRAYELWLRTWGAEFWRNPRALELARAEVAYRNEYSIERLRETRLEAEAQAAKEAARERIAARPVRRPA